MKIILKPAQETPTFSTVEVNQFFVDKHGELCQKVTESQYNVVASANGKPYADHYNNVRMDLEIQKILPIVEKIEF